MSKSMMDRLHPDLLGPVQAMQDLPGGGLNLDDIPAARAAGDEMMKSMKVQMPIIEDVTKEDLLVPGPADAPVGQSTTAPRGRRSGSSGSTLLGTRRMVSRQRKLGAA